MPSTARDAYLETQVLTATPQKLRLMLIEGALRFVAQTQHYWDLDQPAEALEASIRAREILAELMTTVSPEKSPLAHQILPVYSYIFRTLTEAQLEKNRAKLADALRVLEVERETWALVCEKFVDVEEPAPLPVEIAAPQTLAPLATSSAPLSFDSARLAVASPANLAPPRPAPLGALPLPAPSGVSFEA